jgi:exosome complex RNA-binding protein Csl4
MMSIVEKYSSDLLSNLHVKRLLCIRKKSSLSENMQLQNVLGEIEEIDQENHSVESKGTIKAAIEDDTFLNRENAVMKSLSTKDTEPNTEHQSRMSGTMTWKPKSNVDAGVTVWKCKSNEKRFDTGKKIIKICNPICTCNGKIENEFKHSSVSSLNKQLSVSELMAYADRVTTMSNELFPKISK